MSKDINYIFGKNLKKVRLSKNLTQLQLALELDLDTTTISKYEKGSRCPSLKLADKIANVLDVKLSQLIEED